MKEKIENNRISQQDLHYSEQYEKYEKKVYTLDQARLEKVSKLILSEPPGKILDIGCLSGLFLSKLKDKGWNGYGIELSDAYLEARKKGLNVIQCNVEEGIPFDDNFFEVVYAGEIIEHLYDTAYFLEEIRRVVKPKGKVIITTPNITSLINRMLLLFGRYPRYSEYSKDGAGHIHLYNEDVLKKQLEKNGFRVVTIIGNFLSIPDPTPNKMIRNTILETLGTYFPTLSENLIFVAIPRGYKC